MTREEFTERYADIIEDEGLLTADGFDEAILGVDSISKRVIYDRSRMVEVLVDRDHMTELEAIEFLEFNVLNAWVGEKTPIFMF